MNTPPEDARIIDVEGYPVRVVDTGGTGPLVLLVHGSPVSSFAFRRQIDALRRAHRVVAPDLLGFGDSGGPEEGAAFPLQARALATLLAHAELSLPVDSPWCAALHDWGGPIGLAALAALSARRARPVADRLMLINTSVRPDFRPPWYWVFRHRWAGALLVDRLDAFGRGLPLLAPSLRRDRAALESYRRALARRRTRRAAARLEQLDGYREVTSSVGAESLRGRARVLVFWGEPEPYFGERDIAFLRQLFPDLELRRVPGAGHFPMEDAPEALTGAMLAFFGCKAS